MSTKNQSQRSPFSVIRLFDDPTGGRINCEFFNGSFFILNETDLSDEEKKSVLNLLVILSTKMVSLWSVMGSYMATLEKAKLEVEGASERHNAKQYIQQSTELMGWLDLYLVQIKSILDHLVKVPSPVFGYNRWNLASFGERGDKVKKAFENLPKEQKARTKGFYDDIFGQCHWLNDVIELRDKLNHGVRGGADVRMFSVFQDEESGQVRVPMWSPEQEMQEAMEIIYEQVIATCAVFVGMILSLRLSAELTVFCNYSNRAEKEAICQVISKAELARQLEAAGIQPDPSLRGRNP